MFTEFFEYIALKRPREWSQDIWPQMRLLLSNIHSHPICRMYVVKSRRIWWKGLWESYGNCGCLNPGALDQWSKAWTMFTLPSKLWCIMRRNHLSYSEPHYCLHLCSYSSIQSHQGSKGNITCVSKLCGYKWKRRTFCTLFLSVNNPTYGCADADTDSLNLEGRSRNAWKIWYQPHTICPDAETRS